MAAITGVSGSRFAPSGPAAGRAPLLPSGPVSRRGGPVDAGDTVQTEGSVRLYEARGQRFDEAVKIRQVDRTLGRLSSETKDVKHRLEQVKLYPPYPIDESRRARAIRDFNGLTAEVKRMDVIIGTTGGALSTLTPNASTEEAERAVSVLTQVGIAIQASRSSLAAQSTPPAPERAESQSREVAASLGGGDFDGIARSPSDLLRRVD